MEHSLGLCVAGLGAVSGYHLRAIRMVEGAHIAAVVSRSPDKGRLTAEEYGAPRYYQTLEDAVRDPNVDGIVLCTPTQCHGQETRLCIEQGKHVLIEKPITDSYAEALDVAQAATVMGVRVMAGQVSRFLEPYARCKQMIARGDIGQPLHAIEHRLMHRKVFPSWFVGAKGHLINHWGSHPIDLFQWFFDAPAQRVYCHATANLPDAGGEDDVVLCLELAGKAVGTYHHSYHVRYFDTSMVLIGDGGTLRVTWDGSPGSKGKGTGLSVPTAEDAARVRLLYNDQLVFEGGVEEVSEAGFVDQMREFVLAVRLGREPVPSAADTVITMAAVDAARRSACEHRVVAIEEVAGSAAPPLARASSARGP